MSDPLGKSPGQVSDLSSMGLSNGYTDIPDMSVEAITDRVQPRQMPSGNNRGDFTVKGRIVVTDGTYIRIILGLLPDGSYGLAVSKAGYNVEDAFS